MNTDEYAPRGIPPVIDEVPDGSGIARPKTPFRRYRPKGGRPSFLEMEQLTREQFLAVCQSLGTIKAVADHYKVAPKTIRLALRGFGVSTLAGPADAVIRSPLTAYLKVNPTVSITKDNISEISQASGMTTRSIHNWVRARRNATQQYVNSCESLTRLEGKLSDIRGRVISFSAIREYTATVESYSGDVMVRGALLIGGPFQARVPLWDFLKSVHAGSFMGAHKGPEIMWTYPKSKGK